MDPSAKKRKGDENGGTSFTGPAAALTRDDVLRIIEGFSRDQLADIVASSASSGGPAILDAVRAVADRDTVQRKLFIRGLGWQTTNDGLHALFSAYGELDEAVVIVENATGKNKGYGFITFRHVDGALLALKEPSKKIDGKMTVTQLATAGPAVPIASAAPPADVSLRKIYVGNVPADMSPDRLLAHFSTYGEIEAGPLGFDRQTGKFRSYALFVYKTVEGAHASLENPTKTIDGHYLVCKLAIDGKKGKLGAPVAAPNAAPVGVQGQQMGGGPDIGRDGLGLVLGPHYSLPSSLSSQYGVPPRGMLSYGGYPASALPGVTGLTQHQQSSLPSLMAGGTPGLSSVGSQVPSSLVGSGSGGYGGGLAGSYGSSASQYSSLPSGGYGSLGIGISLYDAPQSSVGMPSMPYKESGSYMSSSAYQSKPRQQAISSPGPRIPGGAPLYPSLPPYYEDIQLCHIPRSANQAVDWLTSSAWKVTRWKFFVF